MEAFLKENAKEWKGLKARLVALEAGNARLANVRAEAEGAMERADFDTAWGLLDGAAKTGTEAAVVALRKVAEVHALKAEAWLLQGDADAAAASFETGAMLFRGLNQQKRFASEMPGAVACTRMARPSEAPVLSRPSKHIGGTIASRIVRRIRQLGPRRRTTSPLLWGPGLYGWKVRRRRRC